MFFFFMFYCFKDFNFLILSLLLLRVFHFHGDFFNVQILRETFYRFVCFEWGSSMDGWLHMFYCFLLDASAIELLRDNVEV